VKARPFAIGLVAGVGAFLALAGVVLRIVMRELDELVSGAER